MCQAEEWAGLKKLTLYNLGRDEEYLGFGRRISKATLNEFEEAGAIN